MMIVAVDCQIVFAIDMNLDLEERFEIFDVSVVRSKKLGNPVADSNAFFHPAFTYLRRL